MKAIFPLFNYDDEPSASKGIVSQLPFLCLIVADLILPAMALILPVDAMPLQIPVGLFADAVHFRPHRLRVSVPEPCPIPNT